MMIETEKELEISIAETIEKHKKHCEHSECETCRYSGSLCDYLNNLRQYDLEE